MLCAAFCAFRPHLYDVFSSRSWIDKTHRGVARTLDFADGSGVSWHRKFGDFIEFLTERCSSEERKLYLEAAGRIQTGGIRVEKDEDEEEGSDVTITYANVKVATGATRNGCPRAPDASIATPHSFRISLLQARSWENRSTSEIRPLWDSS